MSKLSDDAKFLFAQADADCHPSAEDLDRVAMKLSRSLGLAVGVGVGTTLATASKSAAATTVSAASSTAATAPAATANAISTATATVSTAATTAATASTGAATTATAAATTTAASLSGKLIAGFSATKVIAVLGLATAGVVGVTYTHSRSPSALEIANTSPSHAATNLADSAYFVPQGSARTPITAPSSGSSSEPLAVVASAPETAQTGALVASANMSLGAKQAVASASAPATATGAESTLENGSELRREVQLIQSAQQALRSGDYRNAEAQAQEHGRAFPHGALALEREGIRAIAMCSTGRVEQGRVIARALHASPMASRIATACGMAGKDGTETIEKNSETKGEKKNVE
jgi:hypothetical protein